MLAGLTQKALAAEAGIAMQTLNHMEAAGHAPARPQELTGTRAGCAKELKALCLCQREPCWSHKNLLCRKYADEHRKAPGLVYYRIIELKRCDRDCVFAIVWPD